MRTTMLLTPEQETERVRSQASEDLMDIASLKKDGPFNRYWMRQLAAKREQMLRRYVEEDSDKCPHEEREILRRLIKFCDELNRMPAEHEASARKVLLG